MIPQVEILQPLCDEVCQAIAANPPATEATPSAPLAPVATKAIKSKAGRNGKATITPADDDTAPPYTGLEVLYVKEKGKYREDRPGHDPLLTPRYTRTISKTGRKTYTLIRT
jgi:hypothetical protein